MADLTFNENGGTQYVSYSLSCDGTVAGTSDDTTWLTVNVTRTNSRSGKINVSAVANPNSQRRGVITLSVNGGQVCTQSDKKIYVTQAAGGSGGDCSGVNATSNPSSKSWNNSTSTAAFTLSTSNQSCPPKITSVSITSGKFSARTTSDTTFEVTPTGDTSSYFNGTCKVYYTINNESKTPLTVPLSYTPGGSGGDCSPNNVSCDTTSLSWNGTDNEFKTITISSTETNCLTDVTVDENHIGFIVMPPRRESDGLYTIRVKPGMDGELSATLGITGITSNGNAPFSVSLTRTCNNCSCDYGSLYPDGYTWNETHPTRITFRVQNRTYPNNCPVDGITRIEINDNDLFENSEPWEEISGIYRFDIWPTDRVTAGTSTEISSARVYYTINGIERTPLLCSLKYEYTGFACYSAICGVSPDNYTWVGDTDEYRFSVTSNTEDCVPVVTNVTATEGFSASTVSDSQIKVIPTGDTSSDFDGTCTVNFTVGGVSEQTAVISLLYKHPACTTEGVKSNWSSGHTFTTCSNIMGHNCNIYTNVSGCLTSCSPTVSDTAAFWINPESITTFYTENKFGYRFEVRALCGYTTGVTEGTLTINYTLENGETGYLEIPLKRPA